MSRLRQLKPLLREILAAPDWEARLAELAAWPARQLTGPLFSLLLDQDELLRWRAVSGFGHVVGRLAGQSLEAARVLMRLCMWRLNEESGNLGWGTPECMAEAMVRHQGLAREYHRILASYIHDPEGREGNYLDHALLRRGAYWGVARLAQVRPELAACAEPTLRAALSGEEDRVSRGLAAWALGSLRSREARPGLESLAGDPTAMDLYRDGRLERTSVGALAAEALARISG
jgi:HEAT repeat protein